MTNRLGLVACLSLVALAGLQSNLPAADTDAEFTAAKAGIVRQFKKKDPSERAAAMKRLKDFPIVDAADMLVKLGFKDDDPNVGRAAYESLLSMKDAPKVAEFLLGQLAKEAKRKTGADLSPAVLAVVLASDSPQVEQEVFKLIDGGLAGSKEGVRLLAGLSDQLGQHGDASGVPTLVKLTGTQAYQNNFVFRRAAVLALCKIPHADAIDALVRLLPKAEGEIFVDIVLHLAAVTKEAHGSDAAAWAKWWQANKAMFSYPALVVRSPERSIGAEDMKSYYGLPIYGHRVVFVLDTSGSMIGGRIEAAKRELIKTIGGLREGVYFGLIVFNSKAQAWQKQLVPANSQTKQAVAAFIDRLPAQGTTASYDALEAAFQFDAEAIYFLTDGIPNGGKVDAPEEIVAFITKGNTTRRESIYTIGIGVGEAGGPFEAFLKTLAERNYGVYRRVDQ